MARILVCLLAVVSLALSPGAYASFNLVDGTAGKEQGGYYQQPSIHDDQIIFCCEDDLWSVPAAGGIARRLTASKGHCSLPHISPDGTQVAFVCNEDGSPEVYVMSSWGGPAQKLTGLGSTTLTLCGWSPDGRDIFFSSNAKSLTGRVSELYAINRKGGMPRSLRLGDLSTASIAAEGRVAIGRNAVDPARWKRYRGGTAGELWVGDSLESDFKPLISLKGNLVWPEWIGQRIYFLSDHEGVGNIYSCLADGSDLKRHSNEVKYYARFPSTDGKRLVYQCGGEIHLLDPASGSVTPVSIFVPANPTQLKLKYVDSKDYLEEFRPHPKGHSIMLIARGKPFSMPFWEGAVMAYADNSGRRYRFADWLPEGEKFVVSVDGPSFQKIELHDAADPSKTQDLTGDTDIGRIVALAAAPRGNKVTFSNHRHELYCLNVDDKKLTRIDKCLYQQIQDISWSPDGRWIAYRFSPNESTTIIRIAAADGSSIHDVTDAVRSDWSPAWDPEGKYLYFLSTRDYHPVNDETQFELSFPMATRPFVIALRNDVPSPLVPKVKPFVKGKDDDKDDKDKEQSETGTKKGAPKQEQKPVSVNIDFSGISGRIMGLPVEEGRYGQIAAAKNRLLYTRFPVKPDKPDASWLKDEEPEGTLLCYDFEDQKEGTLQKSVNGINLASDNQTLVYSSKHKLRVADATKKAEESESKKASEEPGRESGWLDLERVKVPVLPLAEWSQMFDEAWLLQKENFWDKNLSNVDWDSVHLKYRNLIRLMRCRSEVSDLIWEMQGELGTSHAYEFLGDYRQPDDYKRGFLGADMVFDGTTGGYKITKILRGDSWDPDVDSPLAEPGLQIAEGDIITAVGGQPVSGTLSVDDLLVNKSGQRIDLALLDPKNPSKPRHAAVRTLKSESRLRYRAWVEANRKLVHEASKGQLGYVHVPDMGSRGFSEFHRGYLSEYRYPGLVVDVRYNGGGNVSSLLLEKLLRKRIGYDVSRWGLPEPYPSESVAGPIVAVTNQFAGSDGDIFSHAFKQYKLGPLVGKRTWGGVIGIWPRCKLVDGTVTTQPEFSFWFSDVGWGVENYGVDPDYVVENTPQDFRAGRDPQLTKAIDLALAELKAKPVTLPDFSARPSKQLPDKLP